MTEEQLLIFLGPIFPYKVFADQRLRMTFKGNDGFPGGYRFYGISTETLHARSNGPPIWFDYVRAGQSLPGRDFRQRIYAHEDHT